MIIGRHRFVHSGQLTMTLSEAINSYNVGKQLIDALNEAMKR